MKKIGIIKGIRQMSGGRNAFTLKDEKVDEKDVWFNGFALEAEKGDEVEFDLVITDNFNNFSKVKILNKTSAAPAPPSPPQSPPTDPTPGDSGGANIQHAIELILVSPVKDVLSAFRAAQNKLNGGGGE